MLLLFGDGFAGDGGVVIADMGCTGKGEKLVTKGDERRLVHTGGKGKLLFRGHDLISFEENEGDRDGDVEGERTRGGGGEGEEKSSRSTLVQVG